MEYIGRFAPSPTGPLHLGSLTTALASYLDAKHHQGLWHLRIEDIDPKREVEGASDTIIRQLQEHGLSWDRQIIYQSEHHDLHLQAISKLIEQGTTYRCACSRKIIQGKSYAGTCRHLGIDNNKLPLRCTINKYPQWQDRLMPQQQYHVEDIILLRRDGYISYHLASAMDDGQKTITQVVRGGDLMPCTDKHLSLMQQLNLTPPTYMHLPTITDAWGVKLSKQTAAQSIDNTNATENLFTALQLLGQKIATTSTTCKDILAEAIIAWNTNNIPNRKHLCYA